jgi:hypothetical protein
MNNLYKDKYLKYRNKYLTLKNNYKNQIGGNKFLSIPNGGGEGGNLSLQCIWISIRDYLNYHRGEKFITAAALKRSVNIKPETDRTEYDDLNSQLRDGLIRLATQLRISL